MQKFPGLRIDHYFFSLNMYLQQCNHVFMAFYNVCLCTMFLRRPQLPLPSPTSVFQTAPVLALCVP